AGQAWEILTRIAGRLGMNPIRIPPGDRSLYHIGSVSASNFVVGLLAYSTEIWRTLGVPDDDARCALLPLMQGALDNLRQTSVPRALTGPVSRGDIGTVERHLAALASAPELMDVYRSMTRLLI